MSSSLSPTFLNNSHSWALEELYKVYKHVNLSEVKSYQLNKPLAKRFTGFNPNQIRYDLAFRAVLHTSLAHKPFKERYVSYKGSFNDITALFKHKMQGHLIIEEEGLLLLESLLEDKQKLIAKLQTIEADPSKVAAIVTKKYNTFLQAIIENTERPAIDPFIELGFEVHKLHPEEYQDCLTKYQLLDSDSSLITGLKDKHPLLKLQSRTHGLFPDDVQEDPVEKDFFKPAQDTPSDFAYILDDSYSATRKA